ncbi:MULTISPECIES: hypothetical protein [unclassified Sphingomonas]|uniref:hypothetical protein n=1 Tax=unclassified Sphingomonas TaxID=196159 RepID=UPI00226A9C74|nr:MULTISPECIES: hypothetical protein [unclassified Sphingomonas]
MDTPSGFIDGVGRDPRRAAAIRDAMMLMVRPDATEALTRACLDRVKHSSEKWSLRRDRFMTRGGMLKFRIKREAEQNMRAAKRLDEIAISIAALGDEDLLDLADIFRHQPETPIFRWASTEMARRKITL